MLKRMLLWFLGGILLATIIILLAHYAVAQERPQKNYMSCYTFDTEGIHFDRPKGDTYISINRNNVCIYVSKEAYRQEVCGTQLMKKEGSMGKKKK